MTTTTQPRPISPPPGATQRQPAAAGGGSPGLPPIDPVKIVLKYLPLLIAVGVLSGALGVGLYMIWKNVAPSYRSSMRFEATGMRTSLNTAEANMTNDKEFDLFLGTQAQIMTSVQVVNAVIENPQTRRDASNWAKNFEDGGSFDTQAARKDLLSRIEARPLPRTKLIELSVSYSTPNDAFALAGFIGTEYLRLLQSENRSQSFGLRDDLAQRVVDLTTQENTLKRRRDDLLANSNIEDLNAYQTADQKTIDTTQNQLTRVRLQIEDTQTRLQQYRAQLENSPGGIAYPDALRSGVEDDPELRTIRQTITQFEAELGALRQQGIGPNHRTYTSIEARIDSWNQKLELKRQEILRSRFDGLVDGLATGLESLRAQEADMLQRIEDARRSKTETTRILSQVRDIEQEINIVTNQKTNAELQLQEFRILIGLDDASRVRVAARATLPDSMFAPKPLVVVPATMVVLLGLTTGLIFLREVLDQRVKGASDITSLPRVRLVGVIPDASEDPAAPANLAVCYREQPRGVMAESFRQTRSSLAKRINEAGHRSIAVVSAMPGSGATTVVTNLALSCAASDMRVILIDANFRRPSLHTCFGIDAAPGLADALAGSASLESVLRDSGTPNLRVITAGSEAMRISERLSTTALSELIAQASAQSDLVLIDTPPAIVSGDGRAIANRADASILVVRALAETRGLVTRMRNEFSDCQGEFLGVLVNGVKSSAGGYLRRNIKATHEYNNAGTKA